MKSHDLTDLAEFAFDALTMLTSSEQVRIALSTRLLDQPDEAHAVYVANVRAAVHAAIAALSELSRSAKTAEHLFELTEHHQAGIDAQKIGDKEIKELADGRRNG